MKQRYTPEELEGIAREALENALGAPDTDIGEARQRNLDYYNAQPINELAKPEIEDRSDFVATDVKETVEGMLPQFMDIFVSNDSAVDVEPRRPEDAEQAQLAKAWLNYLFYTKNDGLAILHDWFKDACLQKVGFIKVWAEECASDAKQSYEGVTEEQLVMLMQDGWELVEEPKVDDELQGLSFTVRKESRVKQIKACVVAPMNMRVDANSRWDADPAMIGEVYYRRRFELEQDGYIVEDAASDFTAQDNMEMLAMLGEVNDSSVSSPHRSHDLIKFSECYIKLDQDEDGIAEWMKICLINDKLAEYEDGSDAFEQVDGHPYVWICPIPRPHSFYGDCPADLAIGPQKLKTFTTRAIQDNMFLTVNQRTYVDMNAEVEVNDLLESRPGGLVRGRGPNGIMPIVQPNLGTPAYEFNAYIDDWRQNVTGFTKYSQGTDANSLNKTATGVSIITQKSDLRVKLMSRFFAVGVKNMFVKMLGLSIKHQNIEEMVLVNGQFVPINPSHFKNDFNFKINVGLGTGTKEQQSARIMGLLQVMQAGVQMGVVKPENVAEAIKLYVQANEFQNPERFISPPDGGPSPEQIQQGMQQLQEQGQQIQQLAQENEQLQQQLQSKQADLMLKSSESETNAQIKAQELALKERELALKEREQALKEQQAAFEAQMAMAEAENRSAEVGSSGKIAEYQAQTERAAKLGIEAIPGVIEAAATAKIAESFTVLAAQMQTPKTKVGRMVRLPDGSYQMEQVETFDEVVEPTETKSIVESATELVAQMQAPKMKKGKMTKLADGSYQMEQREV
jgi:hypothetical protein